MKKLTIDCYTAGNTADIIPLKDNLTLFDYYDGLSPVDNNNFGGSFDDLGHLYKINSYSKLYRLKLTGTVEGYVANRLQEVPNTAGSITFTALHAGGRITFQGEPVQQGLTTITWNANGEISLS